MAEVAPMTFPSLSRHQAEQLNRIATQRSPLPIPGHEAFTLFRLDHGNAESDLTANRLAIGLGLGADVVVATMPRGLALNLLSSLSPDLSFTPFPPADLAALLLEAVLLPLLEIWERNAGRDMKVRTLVPISEPDALPAPLSAFAPAQAANAKPAAPPMKIHISLRGPGLRQTLTLWGSTDALDRLMHPWRAGSRALTSLPIPASFQIGQTRLPARHVRSLRVGDAVLLQDVFAVFRQNEAPLAYPGIAALRMVLADTLTAMLSQTDTGWRLDTSLRHKSKEDDTLNVGTETNDGEVASSVDLDGLPIQLVFEAARLDLPLGDLRRLGTGSILELDVAPGRVRIIANGRRIGDGELVSIDGRVGVRIMAFSDEADIVPGTEAE